MFSLIFAGNRWGRVVKNKKIDRENGYEIYGQFYNKILEKIDKIIEII